MGKSKKDPGAGLRAEAAEQRRKALAAIEGLSLPDYIKMEDYIRSGAKQVPQLAGLLDAEQLERPKDLEFDPRLKEAQMAALTQMQERGRAGISEEDKLAYQDVRESMAADAASQQADIGRRMAEQGAGGSGQELAQRIAGQQQAALQASKAGRGMAADALQAKMQASQMAGQMAGQMSAADIAKQEQNRAAQQQIAQFNAANRQQVGQYNLGQQQQIANQRAALQQQMYNQLGALQQQKFSNAMSKAGALSGAYSGQANALNQQANQMKPKGGGMLSKIGTVGGAVVGGYFGGPMGATAGASLGGGIGNMMESADGGIVAKNGAVVPSQSHYQTNYGRFSGYGDSSGVAGMLPMYNGVVDESGELPQGVVESGQMTGDQLAQLRAEESKKAQEAKRMKKWEENTKKINQYGAAANSISKGLGLSGSDQQKVPTWKDVSMAANKITTPEDMVFGNRRAYANGGTAGSPLTLEEVLEMQAINSQIQAEDENVHYPEEEGREFSYADREAFERALDAQQNAYAQGGIADLYPRSKADFIREEPTATDRERWFREEVPAGALWEDAEDAEPGSARREEAYYLLDRFLKGDPHLVREMDDDIMQQIKAQKYAQGGVPGIIAENGDVVSVDGGFIFPGEEDEYANDRVDAKVNRGEMILNAEQQQRMLDVLRGEQSPEILKNGEDVVETPEAAQNRGFLKLLEMVGKK